MMQELKSWTHFFQAIKAGEKTHDLRSKKDRSFKVGENVCLREYDPFKGEYTGDSLVAKVTYITDNVTPCAFSSAVLDKDYCILSLRVVARYETPPLVMDHGPDKTEK
jgi:hypothetical protein